VKTNTKISNYIKACRKGSREAELELSSGFVCKHKIHRSLKQYNRQKSKKIDF